MIQLKDIVYVVQFTQFKLEHFLKRQTKNLVWPIWKNFKNSY